jgi:hypothetical protein
LFFNLAVCETTFTVAPKAFSFEEILLLSSRLTPLLIMPLFRTTALASSKESGDCYEV